MVASPRACQAHGEPTRISCVECHKPVCPRCLVRTEVGTKCESCARPVAPRVTRVGSPRLPLLLIGVGVAAMAGLAFLLTRGGPSAARPGSPAPLGMWSRAPDLSRIRGTAVTVLLPDGEVLAAGGGVGTIPLASAELYNPAKGTWRLTGSLNQARRGAVAAVLHNGQVLVAGGVAGSKTLASAEIYNPAKGTWRVTGSMTMPRLDATVDVLPDGDVLVAGGTTPQGRPGAGGGQTISPTASAELYDPATGRWTPTGSMGSPRFEASATLLRDGRVLVAGGFGGAGVPGPGGVLQYPPLRTAEIYDPAVGAFSLAAPLVEPMADQVSVLLPDGSVLLAGGLGGETGEQALAMAERFNPATGTWTEMPPMAHPRDAAAAVLLSSSEVLVVGGQAVDAGVRTSLASAELFDPATDAWRSAGSMPCPRSGLGLVALRDGSVLAIAGDAAFPGQPPRPQNCVDRYVPARTGST